MYKRQLYSRGFSKYGVKYRKDAQQRDLDYFLTDGDGKEVDFDYFKD